MNMDRFQCGCAATFELLIFLCSGHVDHDCTKITKNVQSVVPWSLLILVIEPKGQSMSEKKETSRKFKRGLV